MTKKNKLYALLLFITCSTLCFADARDIALTIDDLPFVGESKNFHLNMIIQALKDNEVPATGFVIAREVNAQNFPVLRQFHDAGLGLGNHTYSHANLNNLSIDAYIQEIDRADKILAPVMSQPRYFRYPYLAMGNGHKKEKILDYLYSKQYQIAPITIDSKDFTFNQLLLSVVEKERREFLTVLKPCYLAFLWQQTLQAEEHSRSLHRPSRVQILLIHANLLNAYLLPDIIHLYKQNGYRFVSLQSALAPSGHDKKSLHETQQSTENISEKSTEEHPKPYTFMAWDE